MERIAVIGTGYVGLVLGVCLADAGHRVICVDNDQHKLAKLQGGEAPFYEPGLDIVLQRAAREEKVTFTENLREAVEASDFLFLCLPTPPDVDGAADLSWFWGVAEDMAVLFDKPKVVVTKSTVPLGTAAKLEALFAAKSAHPVTVVSNPEFLREGTAIQDFLRQERVVVGTAEPVVAERLRGMYQPFMDDTTKFLVMSVESAELTKYASNAFLAMKISFINEVAALCEKSGADVSEVRRGMGADHRIGYHYLQAGIGYGGSCLPKDVKALQHISKGLGAPMQILDSVRAVNQKQRLKLVNEAKSFFGGDLSQRRFAVWGLSFKPGTDDIRESPAMSCVLALLDAGAQVQGYDPVAGKNFQEKLRASSTQHEAFVLVQTRREALHEADALLICTDWKEFQNPDIEAFHESMKQAVIFDGRNLYDPAFCLAQGLTYISIGRKAVHVERS